MCKIPYAKQSHETINIICQTLQRLSLGKYLQRAPLLG